MLPKEAKPRTVFNKVHRGTGQWSPAGCQELTQRLGARGGNTKKHDTDDKNPGFHRSWLRFMIPLPLLLLSGQLIVCGLVHENGLSLVRLGGSRSRTTIAGQERSGRVAL